MLTHLHGISTLEQIRASGIGMSALRTRIDRGELQRLQRNVYRHVTAPESTQQLAAHALVAVKAKGAVTSAAALRLHKYSIALRRSPLDVVVPQGAAVPLVRNVNFRRSSHLDHVQLLDIEDLPVVPAAWAIGDLAYDVSDIELGKVVARAVGERRLTLDRLRSEVEQRGRFPGLARLNRVLKALESDLPFSGTEKRAARALRRAGLPAVLQFSLQVLDLGTSLLLDLAVPQIRFNIEIDGPHHWMPDQAAYDRKRDRGVANEDWTVERYSVYEVDDDMDAFVQQVLRKARQLGTPRN